MKILQLTKKFPYPPKDGEIIAILSATRAFSTLGAEVDVLSINTNKHYFDVSQLPAELNSIADFEGIDHNTDIRIIDALANLFSDKSYHIERFDSETFRTKLVQKLQEKDYDVIYLEGLTMTQYIPVIRQHSHALVAHRSHNVEHEIWERLSKNESNPIKKWYILLLAKRLKKYEINSLNTADVVLPITNRDGEHMRKLGCTIPMLDVPATIELTDYPLFENSATNKKIGFLGGMDWFPNQEGVRWFVESVWPAVRKSHPNAECHIAGRNFSDSLKDDLSSIPGVHAIGEVESAQEFFNSLDVFIVPLQSGSGMRIKILESMALGKAVVSTAVGAEGILYTHQKDIFIADTTDDFAKDISSLLQNSEMLAEMGKAARTNISENYGSEAVYSRVLSFLQKQAKD